MESTLVKNTATDYQNGNHVQINSQDRMWNLLEKEVSDIVNEEIKKAAQEVLDEHKQTIRLLLEEYKVTIQQVLNEEKAAVWAQADELKKSILNLAYS